MVLRDQFRQGGARPLSIALPRWQRLVAEGFPTPGTPLIAAPGGTIKAAEEGERSGPLHCFHGYELDLMPGQHSSIAT